MDSFISIIIPVYNAEDQLANSIESVICQDYENIEIIVVDDGSTDNSSHLIGMYARKDARIKQVYKPNGGVSSARNLGVEKSNGSWIMFLDADDKLSSDAISIFQENICKYKNIKVFISNYSIEDECGHISRGCSLSESQLVKNPVKKMCLGDLYSRPGNTLIHRSVFNLIKGYDENLSYCEDFEFSLRLLNIFQCFYISCPLLTYYANAGASIRIHNMDKDFISVIEFRSMSSIWMSQLMFRSLIHGLRRRKGHEDFKACRKILKENMGIIDRLKYYMIAVYIRIYQLLKK